MTGDPDPPADAPPPARQAGLLRRHAATIGGLLVALAAVALYLHVFVLNPPAPTGPKPVARLSAVQGAVRVKAAGQAAWAEGKPSLVLRTGDVVQTDPKAGAQITFFGGNVVRVRPDSVVVITEGEAAMAEEATAWHVQSGQVSFDVRQGTEVVTATARTRVAADSTGNIDVDDEGGTGVRIFKGSAEVATTAGQKVSLGDNQAVLVDPKGQAGARVELPPPPTLVAPPSNVELPYVPAPQAATRLAWDPVKPAASYHVAIDYNVTQADLLLSAALDEPDISATSHDLVGLDPGTYFWRVAGVTSEGLEGDFSKVAVFSLVKPPAATPRPPAAPRLVVEASDLESVVALTGRTDPGAAVTVDGREVKVLPDGSFYEHMRKGGRPYVVVRATTADGRVAEQKRALPAR